MLLVSCGKNPSDPAAGNPNDDPDGGKTPAQLEAEANALYAAAIAKWLDYVEYEAPDVNGDPEIFKSYLAELQSSSGYGITWGGKLAVITKTVDKVHSYTVPTDPAAPVDPENPVEPTVLTYGYELRTVSVVDVESGTELLKLEVTDYRIGGNSAINAPDINRANHVVYNVELLLDGAMIEVSKTVYELRALTEQEQNDPDFVLDTKLESSWNLKTTYSYYDNAGTKLLENLEDRASVRGSLLDVDQYTYATEDGEIIRRFALGMELPFPTFGASSETYDYISSGDYHYLITERPLQYVKMGDALGFILPGMSVQILNKEYSIVGEYVSDSYSIMGYSVLPNGDFYICEYEELESNATEYDILMNGQKLDVLHTVISATTGAVTTAEKDFVAQFVYTEPMYDVNTAFQMQGKARFPGVCAMKGDYMLASVQKFSDGVLGSDSVIAVLNGSLEIVAELPKIVPNQFGYIGFLNADQAIIASQVQSNVSIPTVERGCVYYAVDTKTGDLELYYHDKDSVTVIDGGYIYEGVVYDYNWKELYTFADNESFRILDGHLLITRQGSDGVYYYNGYIAEKTNSDDGYGDDEQPTQKVYEFKKLALADGYRSPSTYCDHRFFSVKDSYSNERTIYNLSGEVVLRFEEGESRSFYESTDSSSYSIYRETRSYNIFELTEGVYCIEVYTVWERTGYYGYESASDVPYPEQFSGYSYYIIK